ncbi:MAG TPA: RNA 2',3'-cyclic phosphodiesterase [Syntrophomonadaceae bacterium]|nr:RNA 2',3'-cyclic phosphodiesterase [Syntrophomonadaceae bacterium]HQE22513.1 RNA 2',3'-cyclic phosphodiesterase [Syntrophomonadaceae bacterium]
MRLFTAIPVPDEIKDYTSMIRKELEVINPDVKWVEKENYHLTLKFLGDVPVDMLEPLCDFLERAAVSSPSFKLRLQGMGFYPNRRRPRVIWIGISGEMEKALFLGDRVDAYLSTLGFEAEARRDYHLTLGRIRSERNLNELVNKISYLGTTIQTEFFTVTEFYLMESQLTSKGSVYTVKRKFTLD